MQPEASPKYPDRIAVALSGGGHRATLFALGVLMYLVDAGLNDRVETITSVSGGSITNGYVAQECDFRSVKSPEFRAIASRLCRVIAFRGTVFSSWLTWMYLAGIVALASGAIVAVFILTGKTRIVGLVVLLILLGIAVGLRGSVASAAFGRALFTHGPLRTLLADTNDAVCHVICSTDLLAGRPFYFSSQFIQSFRHGWSPPQRVKLQTAVQASAALPGAFPPRRMNLRRLSFPPLFKVGTVYLVDGGVYNNLGIDWFVGHSNRRGSTLLSVNIPEQRPNLLIVVSSSAPGLLRIKRVPLAMRVPYLKEFAVMPQVMDVLYANTVEPRIHALVDETTDFEPSSSLPGPWSRRGWDVPLVIAIEGSPFFANLMGKAKASNSSPFWQAAAERAKRLRAVMDEATYHGKHANEIPTNLTRLGREKADLVVRHGYVCAMSYLHVFIGSELFESEYVDEVVASMLG